MKRKEKRKMKNVFWEKIKKWESKKKKWETCAGN